MRSLGYARPSNVHWCLVIRVAGKSRIWFTQPYSNPPCNQALLDRPSLAYAAGWYHITAVSLSLQDRLPPVQVCCPPRSWRACQPPPACTHMPTLAISHTYRKATLSSLNTAVYGDLRRHRSRPRSHTAQAMCACLYVCACPCATRIDSPVVTSPPLTCDCLLLRCVGVCPRHCLRDSHSEVLTG